MSREGLSTVPKSMIGRVSLILQAFTVTDPVLSLGALSKRTAIPKATVARITQELVDTDLLERVEHGYQLGMRCFELGEMVGRSKLLRRLAVAAMSDLRQATGLTVQLTVLRGGDLVYIEILHGRSIPEHLPSRVGGRVPAHASAAGKALMAYSDTSVTAGLLAGPLMKLGPRTITDTAVLHRQFAEIRATGVAFEVAESAEGVACVSSPLLRQDRSPIAAISLTGPASEGDIRRFAPTVYAATLGLNRQIRTNPALGSL
ncbi:MULTISPECIES: IclR family transcriptional regulator [unclassified Pseudoclavibacter]|uniref:IclR family transcriptional regulator n=1 Tax=unclassified Pseudoclavibacter TaxID=2615177 RepID=UPI0013010764|nr:MULTISPECIES: IclR family transcriptional regulator [unclassified Pseudoclavibacter]KAB1657393.1 IclR family transcriptional regulator [Pseudoclavibacter sp. CFCC 11306]KAB1660734.1 IclR family transcriptional regulator [Pseudoclavibacter sp. CFCC 13796]